MSQRTIKICGGDYQIQRREGCVLMGRNVNRAMRFNL